jgi:biopolymer transport protein ExbB
MKAKYLYLACVLAATCLLAASSLLAQSPSPAAAGEAAKPPATQKNLLELIGEGGYIMIPIGLCSVFTLYLIGDGFIRTGVKKNSPPEYEFALKDLFRQGDYVGAYNYCKENPSPLTNVIRKGVSLLGEGKQVTEEGMLAELAKEHSRVQTWISYLSVVGVCTPMIGLLGTVTGMIKAFATLGSSGIGDPSSLAAAIGEVLVATASGLFIAIPAFGAFYFLRNRSADSLHRLQDLISELFRKMPYEMLSGVHIGDDELYAATPNWLAHQQLPEGHHPVEAHNPEAAAEPA